MPTHHHDIVLGAIAVLLLLITGVSGHEEEQVPILTKHGGPLLTCEIQLGLMWYGIFSPAQKQAVKQFICSLSAPAVKEPSVAKWWSVVESFQLDPDQARANAPPPPIKVSIVNEACDEGYSIGKIMTVDFIPQFMCTVSGGNKNMVVVIFTAKDVTVQGLCMGLCSMHGQVEKQVYIVVGNPETECPDSCGWPFVESEDHPGGPVLKPIRAEWSAEALVMNLAAGLASTVTNPENNGYYAGQGCNPEEAGMVCDEKFGSGATEGTPGKVEMDPITGGAFNAYGATEEDKFLLPGLWCPATQTCWSLL